MEEEHDVQIHISTKFFPGSHLTPNLHLTEPDIVLVSSDSVFFYVHSNVLLERSRNGFNGVLGNASGPEGRSHFSQSNYESMNMEMMDHLDKKDIFMQDFSSFLPDRPPLESEPWGQPIPDLPPAWPEEGLAGNFFSNDENKMDFDWSQLFDHGLNNQNQNQNESPPKFNLHLNLSKSSRDTIARPSPGTPDPRTEPNKPVFSLEEDSGVLNVLLHTIYGLDSSSYSPSLETLFVTVLCLVKYGYDLKAFLAKPQSQSQSQSRTQDQDDSSLPPPSLFSRILAYAPERPLEVYTFAASYHLEELAVETSRYILSYSLSDLTDGPCMQMGSVYLKRLFFLHLGRIEALKRLLMKPPTLHELPPLTNSSPGSNSSRRNSRSTSASSSSPSTLVSTTSCQCSAEQQDKLSTSWAQMTSQLTQGAGPDITSGRIESVFAPLVDQVWCEDCRRSLVERVKEVCKAWDNIKMTI